MEVFFMYMPAGAFTSILFAVSPEIQYHSKVEIALHKSRDFFPLP